MECINNDKIKCLGYNNDSGSITLIIKPLTNNILENIENSKTNKTIIEKNNDFIIYYCNINNYQNESLDKTNGNLKLDLKYIGNFKKMNNDLFFNPNKFKILNRYVHKQNINNILDNIYFSLIKRKFVLNFINYDYKLYEINEGINIYILIAKLKVNIENIKHYRMVYIFHGVNVFYYLCTFID
jgi:hypothetical protein